MVWEGQRWTVDETNEVERRAKRTVRALYSYLPHINDADRYKAFVRHALKSEYATRIHAMVKLAQSEHGITLTSMQLDLDPWLLTVENGTLDLRNGSLRPHRREDLMSKMAPVVYDADGACPTWDKFLERVLGGDDDLVRYMQKVVGYALTGDTSEQCLFVLYGTGANGKSTLLNVVKEMLGDYAKQTPTTSLLTKKHDSIPNDIARLQGTRCVMAVEAEIGKQLAETLVKQLTGGDTVTARFLYKEYFEFRPDFKLFLAVNHRPEIQGTDPAIWRRIRLIPFAVTIPEAERDKRLPIALREELPGILRWAVKGCLAWQEEALGSPSAVAVAIAQYRDDMDHVGAFIEARCVVAPEAKTAGSRLYNAYQTWCTHVGEDAISNAAFAHRLQERGFRKQRTSGVRLWKGLGLGKGLGVTDDAP
jgi:putative DNA primase/helicase